MADISHDTVLSAAWMLMRRAREAGSASDRSDIFGQVAEQSAWNTQDAGPTYTKEAVMKLIAAYLDTPTHISSPFHSW